MTLYDTIFTRRQVRSFTGAPLSETTIKNIAEYIQKADQITGQHVRLEIVPAKEMSANQGASHYLLSFCENNCEEYANAGYVMQMADLYIQSIGLGSGWFMNAKPKESNEKFCIAIAFGETVEPFRKSANDFKRKPVDKICLSDNNIVQAVRLAPSSMNSQPWKLTFESEKLIIEESKKGISRIILKNKLNKIDVGIAARHAVTALAHEGKSITQILADQTDNKLKIEITYK